MFQGLLITGREQLIQGYLILKTVQLIIAVIMVLGRLIVVLFHAQGRLQKIAIFMVFMLYTQVTLMQTERTSQGVSQLGIMRSVGQLYTLTRVLLMSAMSVLERVED